MFLASLFRETNFSPAHKITKLPAIFVEMFDPMYGTIDLCPTLPSTMQSKLITI